MLHNQHFIAPVEAIVKRETEKAVDVEWESKIDAEILSKRRTVRMHGLQRQASDPSRPSSMNRQTRRHTPSFQKKMHRIHCDGMK